MSESSGIARSGSPPKVRLTFRVGVVGHRPNRLKREDIPLLAGRLGEVLSSVKKAVSDFSAKHPGLFSSESPRLRAISPLAEGTDRYFARESLKLGYELFCPLPFHKEEFENDFKPPTSLEPDINSVAEFNNILDEARNKSGVTIFELDGTRDEPGEAYAAAGRLVLNQSDLLVVVWDGGGENKRGGTYETLVEAVKFAVPVLWIDARAPHPWQLLQLDSDLPACVGERCIPQQSGQLDAKLNEIIQHVLRPPEAAEENYPHRGHKPDLRKAYFAERRRKWNFFFFWKLFRDFFGSFRIRVPAVWVQHFEDAVAHDWPKDAPSEVERWVNNQLRSHYAWSDKLADFYADRYRSSFVMAYLFGALAVLLALFAHFSHSMEGGLIAWSIGELVLLATILLLVILGNRYHWHQRWMDYRLIAELVRQLRFLVPIGGGRPFPRLPQHLSFGNPINSWMYWHLRSIDRDLGLPDARLTADYLRECIAYIARIVRDQITFHRTAATRSERIEHRLHRTGFVLFFVALLMVAVHVLQPAWQPLVRKYLMHEPKISALDTATHSEWDIWLIGAAWLPAIGAALAAINNQGEFARVARRSLAMAGRLEQDLERLLNYRGVSRSSEVAEDALRVAQTMVDEVLDWRLVFLDRPLVAPA
jgi:hypothetical protein